MNRKKVDSQNTNETIETYRNEGVANSFDPDRSKYEHQKYKNRFEANILKKVLHEFKGKDVKILDVACGTGRMLPVVFKHNQDAKYFGLDTSKVMTKYLIKKAEKLGKEKVITLVYSNAAKMPFKDN